MPITKVGPKYQVTIPKAVHEQAGLDVGNLVEAEVSREGILLRPKAVVDKHPAIEKRLREGFDDIKKGRVHGPFDSAEELVSSLHGGTKPRKKSTAANSAFIRTLLRKL
jgi:AbrB family looped-hinge helix DNA binding protein